MTTDTVKMRIAGNPHLGHSARLQSAAGLPASDLNKIQLVLKRAQA
jgi:hypothetical protein